MKTKYPHYRKKRRKESLWKFKPRGKINKSFWKSYTRWRSEDHSTSYWMRTVPPKEQEKSFSSKTKMWSRPDRRWRSLSNRWVLQWRGGGGYESAHSTRNRIAERFKEKVRPAPWLREIYLSRKPRQQPSFCKITNRGVVGRQTHTLFIRRYLVCLPSLSFHAIPQNHNMEGVILLQSMYDIDELFWRSSMCQACRHVLSQ